MAFDKSGAKVVWAARLGNTPKRCELQLFLAGIRQAIRRLKAFHLGRLSMQFQQDWPKDKNYSSFNFFGWKLRKISLDWALWCASRGIDNFLNCRSTCGMSMESYRLTELKYWIFSRTGRKTKELRRLELFLWTVFKHGLLGGWTILLQYSAITRTPLESSRLGELKYSISAG